MKYLPVLMWLLIGLGCRPATQSSLQVSQLLAPIEAPAPVDTLVVCPPEFQPALEDWIDYRTRQGHVIQVLAPQQDAVQVAEQIRDLAQVEPLKFVFLIGDVADKRSVAAEHTKAEQPQPRRSSRPSSRAGSPGSVGQDRAAIAGQLGIPMHYITAEVNHQFGSEPEIATDYPYSDFDGDGLPDVALGRLPAQSEVEVRDYLERVMAYEQNPHEDQSWRRRINFVAGVGGFGQTIDGVLEQITKEVITGMIPAEYDISMTLGSWRSPFCPDPRKFEQTVIQRFNQGCQFLVYIGHGLPTELGKLRLPDRKLSIFNCSSASEIDCSKGNPIAIFLACYTGAIDHPTDCLTKVLLRQPAGPIAIISGTRVTMPYGMSLMMLEFADQLFEGQPETLGELMQTAKSQMVLNQTSSFVSDHPAETAEESQLDRLRRMVQGTGIALSPSPDLLAAECQEHVLMMHLFGDPLLKLQRPERISVTTPLTAQAGTTLQVEGTAPRAGRLCIELAYPRERFRKRPQYRRTYQATDQEFQRYQAAYQDAHDLTCGVCTELVEAGPFQLQIDIPEDVSGECVVRCMLWSDKDFALGAQRLTIQK